MAHRIDFLFYTKLTCVFEVNTCPNQKRKKGNVSLLCIQESCEVRRTNSLLRQSAGAGLAMTLSLSWPTMVALDATDAFLKSISDQFKKKGGECQFVTFTKKL